MQTLTLWTLHKLQGLIRLADNQGDPWVALLADHSLDKHQQ